MQVTAHTTAVNQTNASQGESGAPSAHAAPGAWSVAAPSRGPAAGPGPGSVEPAAATSSHRVVPVRRRPIGIASDDNGAGPSIAPAIPAPASLAAPGPPAGAGELQLPTTSPWIVPARVVEPRSATGPVHNTAFPSPAPRAATPGPLGAPLFPDTPMSAGSSLMVELVEWSLEVRQRATDPMRPSGLPLLSIRGMVVAAGGQPGRRLGLDPVPGQPYATGEVV